MTGAPKLRTMDLIDRIEGRPRGMTNPNASEEHLDYWSILFPWLGNLAMCTQAHLFLGMSSVCMYDMMCTILITAALTKKKVNILCHSNVCSKATDSSFSNPNLIGFEKKFGRGAVCNFFDNYSLRASLTYLFFVFKFQESTRDA